MKIYLFTFDMKYSDKILMNNFLSQYGDVVPAHDHASFLSSELTEEELHQAINKCADHYDQWVITKLDDLYNGVSHETKPIRDFMRRNRFI